MFFSKKRKARKLAEQKEKEALERKKAEILSVEPAVEVKQEEPDQPTVKVEKKVEQPKTEPVKKVAATQKKAEQPKTEPVKKVAATQKKAEQPKPEEASKENKVVKYHVSQNKDPRSDSYRSWRVRKQGSQKTIKYFPTQKEAIEYAENLAESAGSSIVIHKMDGSIRKQDYTKKS